MRLWLGFCIALLVAACGDPMATVPRLSDQDIPEDRDTLSVLSEAPEQKPRQGGFLAALLGGGTDDENTPGDATAIERPATDDQEGMPPETAQAPREQQQPAPKRRGLFALFAPAATDAGPAPAQAAKDDTQDSTVDGQGTEEVQLASLQPDQTKASRGGGLLGGLGGGAGKAPRADTAQVRDVAPGVFLPYGQVGRVCGLPRNRMGKKIADFPDRRPTYALYDSEPGNTAAHTFFLTGFADGCARQFTASLAVFGSVGMHEQLRYGLPAEVQPYSDTDKAYETLKSRICKVPRRKPCGSRIGRLEKDTVFVSVYERFGSNAHWKNLLLHDGAVLALDRKSAG